MATNETTLAKTISAAYFDPVLLRQAWSLRKTANRGTFPFQAPRGHFYLGAEMGNGPSDGASTPWIRLIASPRTAPAAVQRRARSRPTRNFFFRHVNRRVHAGSSGWKGRQPSLARA